ncbi:nicotinate-nucleotide adenylyltransferase [Methylococcus capsulatus]|uniref:nicotinate-nucleotide adenylyltransferase n=1 Tax=Methylococcus capsulatus TaxID=414 RepID=UPI0002EAD491|nr:nicotinate-nucleotide adenylyltransferase [Methylococcus capsulatus]QXP87479.1 nicotinate-nucleotide adenylyltransferase [Methylococcus capsulatus]QXP92782.1 nicotinate-nucleotide adenylyltransferase [Methylococcus capsulatus]UQN12488.1 nicotinate-nucleotide adenylyltransferase [Methylococcus capsulatus]
MIGIYGGTFDPVHYGHLRAALEVREDLELRELRFLPCHQPPHRPPPVADPQTRLRMLEIALADADGGFALDTRELDRGGPSYMVDTLSSIRKETGDEPLCLILGLDAFLALPAWHRWRRLFSLAHIVVLQRPDYDIEYAEDLKHCVEERQVTDPTQLAAQPDGMIYFLEVTQLAIASTSIRRMLREGRSAKYLLPDAVLELIHRESLYAK